MHYLLEFSNIGFSGSWEIAGNASVKTLNAAYSTISIGVGGSLSIGDGGINKISGKGANICFSNDSMLSLAGSTVQLNGIELAPNANAKIEVAQGANAKILSSTVNGSGTLVKTGEGRLSVLGLFGNQSQHINLDVREGALRVNGGISNGIEYSGATYLAGIGKIVLSGGTLEFSGAKFAGKDITINLSGNYQTADTWAIHGIDGNSYLDSAVTIAKGDFLIPASSELSQTSLVAHIALSYNLYKTESTLTGEHVSFNLDADFERELSDAGWNWSINNGVLTLSIPEPSLFGVLAGMGALALVASRRRRRN